MTPILTRVSRKSDSFITVSPSAFLAGRHLGSIDLASALNAAKCFVTTWSCNTATAPTQVKTTPAFNNECSTQPIASSMNALTPTFPNVGKSFRRTSAGFLRAEGGSCSATNFNSPVRPDAVSSHPSAVRTARPLVADSTADKFHRFADGSPSSPSLI